MRELIYIGRNNAADLVLTADGALLSVTPLTRVVVELGGTSIDSAVVGFGAGQPIDTTRTATVKIGNVEYPNQSYLRLKLGAVPGLVAGLYAARLITFDVDHPAGLVWTDELEIEVAE